MMNNTKQAVQGDEIKVRQSCGRASGGGCFNISHLCQSEGLIGNNRKFRLEQDLEQEEMDLTISVRRNRRRQGERWKEEIEY